MCSVRAEEIAEDYVDVDARGVEGRGGGLEERDEQRSKSVVGLEQQHHSLLDPLFSYPIRASMGNSRGARTC